MSDDLKDVPMCPFCKCDEIHFDADDAQCVQCGAICDRKIFGCRPIEDALRAKNERLRRVAKAAHRFHHRYCDGADEHEQAVRWAELDAALAALDGKEKP